MPMKGVEKPGFLLYNMAMIKIKGDNLVNYSCDFNHLNLN